MSPDKPKPNIVFVLFDDLGYSDLGCYGGEISTPNIDALAAGGVRFEGMHNSARCCPSRAALMTGLYPPQAGIADFVSREPHPTKGPAHLGRLREDCVTLAEVLRPAGYNCYYSGKWHMHEATDPVERGFDEFYGYCMDHSHDQYDASYYQRLPGGRRKEIDPPAGQYYATDVFNQYALEFVKQGQVAGSPWLLYLSHSSPHFPLQAPKAMVNEYYETYLQGWDVLRERRFARMKEMGLVDGERWSLTERSMVPVDDQVVANGYAGKQNPAWESLPEDRRRDLARRMALFAAMVERVDQGVGKITSHLRESGDLDNTLILITSDNGACYEWGPYGFDESSRKGTTRLHTGEDLERMGGRGTYHSYGSGWANLCNTPLRMYKHFTHEGGVKAPLIAHWPAEFEGTGEWIRGLTHVVDLMPTLRKAAEAVYPAERKGRAIPPEEGISLLPAMQGVPLPERSLFFSHQQARAVINGRWKIVWSKRTLEPLEWELYDLVADPCESRNLADQYPEKVQAMAAEWEEYRTRVGLEEFEPWHIPELEGISD
jgi:arylsulfatase